MHHLADIVGIAFGLLKLRDIWRERVLLMDLLKTSLVVKLERKKYKIRHSIKVKINKSSQKKCAMTTSENDTELTSLL